MIVNVAAWLYIIQVAIGVVAMFLMPFRMSLANFLSLLACALIVAMSVGLLQRRPLGRWLAVGFSLIGWTLGSLVLIYAIVGMLKAPALFVLMLGFMFTSVIGFVVLAFLVIFIAIIVIDFKLYFYLRSPAGAAEFDVELESDASVAGAAGVWVASYMLVFLFTDLRLGSFLPSRRIDTSAESAERQREVQDSRRRAERELRERRQRDAERQAAEQQQLEARSADESAQVVAEAQYEAPDTSAAAELPARVVQQAATVGESSSESENTSRNTILKCRDATGNVQYTQGYCPPGTTRVEMPTN